MEPVGTTRERLYIPKQSGKEFSSLKIIQCEPGKEQEIPDDALAVVSRLNHPISYPKNCPRVTQELLDIPEQKGLGWLPQGRASFIVGLMNKTIPRNPCTKHFSSYQLGGPYRDDIAMVNNEPEQRVMFDEDTFSVRVISPQ